MSQGINLMEEKVEQVEVSEEDLRPREQVKRIIEALLFSSDEAISLQRIRDITDEVCPLSPSLLRGLIDELNRDYTSQGHAFNIDTIGEGYLLRTRKEYGSYVATLHSRRRVERLSPAGTEVLAIIAHRQPIIRPEIDKIRGVDSSGVLVGLVERGLVEVVGKADAPGRPSLYATTKRFLQHFGLRSLADFTKKGDA